MTLRTCSQCRRHFADEAACPFCAAPAPLIEPRRFSTARLSRAAVFAGLAGCYTSNPPPQYGPPPPPPPPPVEQPQPPPQEQHFAEPPTTAGHSRIEGVITDSATGAPMNTLPVQLLSTAQPPAIEPRTTRTDANGHYSFVDLPPGVYVLKFGYGNPRRGGPPQETVKLASDGDVTIMNYRVYTPPPSNVPMPYGAPPARHRIV